MLTRDDCGMIRRAFYQDGQSRRAIGRTYGYHRKTIGKALAQAEPARYQRSHPPPAPMLGSYHDIIEQILASDVEALRRAGAPGRQPGRTERQAGWLLLR